MNATIEDGPAGPQWTAANNATPFVDWADDDAPITHPDGEYLDLRRQAGLRLWVRHVDGNARLLVQLHHACCDGIATLQFIGDLLSLYAAAAAGAEAVAALPELPPERLLDRGLVDAGAVGKPSLGATLRDVWVTGRVWRRILFRRCAVVAGAGTAPDRQVPSPLDAESPGQAGASQFERRTFLPFATHVLEREQTAGLKRAAKARGVTLNDLLLRDMFLAISNWSRAHGEGRLGACRINMPVYVRGRGAADISASNGIGFSFVTVDPDALAGRQALLDAVHLQTQQIKQWKLALYFLGGLAAATAWKRVVPWVLNRRKSLATVVVSYLGPALAQVALPRRDDHLVCGGAVLERIAGVPPVRPLTRASLVALEYAGRLTLALRCDAHLLSTARHPGAARHVRGARLDETVREAS